MSKELRCALLGGHSPGHFDKKLTVLFDTRDRGKLTGTVHKCDICGKITDAHGEKVYEGDVKIVHEYFAIFMNVKIV